jgi:CBS domain-containing protein
MLTTNQSEFNDEYQDWLEGTGRLKPEGGHWYDRTLGEMEHAPVLSVPPNATIEKVIALMNENHQTAVLVTEDGHAVGIFTERDVLTRVLPGKVNPAKACVGDLMTPRPHVLPESTLVSAALRTLALGSYHHLPVVDQAGHPKALVSLQTIVAYVADLWPREIMNAPPEHEAFPPVVEGG